MSDKETMLQLLNRAEALVKKSLYSDSKLERVFAQDEIEYICDQLEELSDKMFDNMEKK